jgi:hypothetical protein
MIYLPFCILLKAQNWILSVKQGTQAIDKKKELKKIEANQEK